MSLCTGFFFHRLLCSLCRVHAVSIAICGCNLPLLRKNSRIVRLLRPVEELESAGRPLSEKFTAARLATEREQLYNAWQEISVPVTEPTETAERIIKEVGL